MICLVAWFNRSVTFSDVTITSESADTLVVLRESPFKSLLSCIEDEDTVAPAVVVGASKVTKFVGLTVVLAVGLVPALRMISFSRAMANRALRCASAYASSYR